MQKKYLSQAFLNLLFEDKQIQMDERYADVMKTVVVTLVFAPIFPFGWFFGFSALLLNF